MRYIFLLLLAYSLQAAGFWTLTGLQKANIYVKNELSSLKVETLDSIKNKMRESLKKEGVKMGEQDSATLMISLEELTGEDTHFVYIKLALGEEVQTYRAAKTSTFAMTYTGSDFIEVDATELDSSVLESVDFLLSQFNELYEDDNE